MNLADQIEALDAKATAGPWETDSTDNGGSGSERFNYYSVGAGPAGKWETIVDTLNSDVAEIHEEWDGDEHGVYHHAWDDQGRANCELIVALRNAVPEILAALRLAETSSITALSDGAPSALADRVETSATPSDVAELVERLLLIAGWRKPGGPTPKKQIPSVYLVCSEAAATLTALSQRLAELEEELVGCDLIPEGDHAKLLSRIAELEGALQWYADPSTWFGSYCGGTAPMNDDVSYVGGEITQGKRARAALEGGTDEA